MSKFCLPEHEALALWHLRVQPQLCPCRCLLLRPTQSPACPLPSPSAAGNGGYNNDARPSYPASFKFKGNVAVANINSATVIDTSR